MSLLVREKPDGSRGAGYLVYLACGAGAIAAIFVLHRRLAGEGPHRVPARRDTAADVSSITQPSSAVSPVRVSSRTPAAASKSYRLGGQPDRAEAPGASQKPSAEPFDPIGVAVAEAPLTGTDGRGGRMAPIDAGGAEPAYAALPPAFEPEPPRSAKGPAESRSGSRAALFGYRDREADPAAEGGPPRAAAPVPPPGDWLPRGTLIFAYLLTTVDTSNPAAVIEFAVARDVTYHNRCRIGFGTRILGRIRGRPVRSRVNLGADTLLFADGTERSLAASAVEADEAGSSVRPGVSARYVPPPPWVRAAPYASDLFTGFMGLLESRAQAPWTAGMGGYSVPSGQGGLRAPLYQAGAQAMQDFAQARLREFEERYAAYYLVPAGSECWLQLDSDLDLSAARSGRVPPRPAADLPSSTASQTHVPASPEATSEDGAAPGSSPDAPRP